jgi:hypothetical protein
MAVGWCARRGTHLAGCSIGRRTTTAAVVAASVFRGVACRGLPFSVGRVRVEHTFAHKPCALLLFKATLAVPIASERQ